MQTLKGAQRRMVQVRIGNSRYYEQALFILKTDLPSRYIGEGEMLLEANRILYESFGQVPEQKRRPKVWVWLFCGFFLGAISALAVFFLRFYT